MFLFLQLQSKFLHLLYVLIDNGYYFVLDFYWRKFYIYSSKISNIYSAYNLPHSKSFNLLLELGLLVKTANGFRQRDPMITTDDEVQDLMVKQYHQQMLSLSKDKLSELASQDRDFSALTFSIRRKDFPNLKKQIQLMRKELLDFSADAGEGDDVVQVNIQLFPLTRGM